MLYQAAPDAGVADPTVRTDIGVRSIVKPFSKTQPVGVSLADHYAAFAAKIEELKMQVYNKTRKFSPNFMVITPDVLPVMMFVPGFTAASVSQVNGPYKAGTISGMTVYVSPNFGTQGEFFIGVNQGALQASAGVFAPYMACVPTQLLQFADGGSTQGWSTMYDCKILNADLLLKSSIVA